MLLPEVLWIGQLCSTVIINLSMFILLITSCIIKYSINISNTLYELIMNVVALILHILNNTFSFTGALWTKFLNLISRNPCSLVNFCDTDFDFGTTADNLFNQHNFPSDLNQAHQFDTFHIYLSKLLYENPDFIKLQCSKWGFETRSIEVLDSSQRRDFREYTYCTQAAVIRHKKSNSIIIAFRGTEPTSLLQWLTDAAVDFIDVTHGRFERMNNGNTGRICVHAGFYHALGLHLTNLEEENKSMFIQLLNVIKSFKAENNNKCNIFITGHSLGAALASLFSFALLAYEYDDSICGVYTFGQPLVGNHRYAEIMHNRLGNKIHRWINHGDIVARIPVISLRTMHGYFRRRAYSDALEMTANNRQPSEEEINKLYYHSGLRFKINRNGHISRNLREHERPMRGLQETRVLCYIPYKIKNVISSFFTVSKLRSILWCILFVDFNDHFPGDYARRIKQIVKQSA